MTRDDQHKPGWYYRIVYEVMWCPYCELPIERCIEFEAPPAEGDDDG